MDDNNQYLWRYMSLAKYIDLISTQTIYCGNINNFIDMTEGEWLEHLHYKSLENLWLTDNKCLSSMKKINDYIFKLKNPTVNDIQYAFNNLISGEDIIDLDYSDDVTQVTDENFFENIDEYLNFLEYMQMKYEDFIDDNKPDDIADIKSRINDLKKRSFISPWFSKSTHCMAMWNTYSAGSEGIAIKVNKKAIDQLLHDNLSLINLINGKFLFEQIIYIDYNADIDNLNIRNRISSFKDRDFLNLFIKHISFQFESEYRIAIIIKNFDDILLKKGIKLKIASLNDFIEEIYLNPLINKRHWMVNVIKEINNKWLIDNNKIRFGRIESIIK